MLDGDPRPAELHVAGVAVRPLTPAKFPAPSVTQPPGSTLLSPAKVVPNPKWHAPDYLLLGAGASVNSKGWPPRDLDPGHRAGEHHTVPAGVNLLRSGHIGDDTQHPFARATLLPGPQPSRYTKKAATGKPLSRARSCSLPIGRTSGSDLRGHWWVAPQLRHAAQPSSGAIQVPPTKVRTPRNLLARPSCARTPAIQRRANLRRARCRPTSSSTVPAELHKQPRGA